MSDVKTKLRLVKLGRPSTYSEAFVTAICNRISSGESLRQICDGDETMPDRKTIYRWLADERYLAFRDRYAHARMHNTEQMSDEIMAIADEPALDHVQVQAKRLRIDTRKWLMGKLNPKKYGERVAIDHSGSINTPEDLTDADLAAIAAGHRATDGGDGIAAPKDSTPEPNSVH